MRFIRIALISVFLLATESNASQATDRKALHALQSDSILDLPRHAVERSQITLPGSTPFHLKAAIRDAKNAADTEYRASVEEDWVSPRKWRRVVTAPHFSQTLIVNGDAMREDVSGDYDPNWLRTIVNALFDPGAPLQGVDLSASDDNPNLGGTEFCRRFASTTGIGPAANDVFSTYCFEKGLISSINKPGYLASYADYQPFSEALVARRIREYLQRGLELEAHINELTELKEPAESLFTIREPNRPIPTVFIDEKTARDLATNAPPVQWPTIEDGDPKGVLSIYVSIDRAGQVRETHNLNTDNPDISDAAAAQLLKWRFKPLLENGAAVQMETILTFAFETKLEKK